MHLALGKLDCPSDIAFNFHLPLSCPGKSSLVLVTKPFLYIILSGFSSWFYIIICFLGWHGRRRRRKKNLFTQEWKVTCTQRIMFKPSLVTNKFMGITHRSIGGCKAATPLRSLIHSTTTQEKLLHCRLPGQLKRSNTTEKSQWRVCLLTSFDTLGKKGILVLNFGRTPVPCELHVSYGSWKLPLSFQREWFYTNFTSQGLPQVTTVA